MITAGILGGIGSGKSTVTAMLVTRGATAIDADRLGHEALREPEVKSAVRREFGDAVFDADGWIVRASLARMVFDDSPEGRRYLAALEAIVHPRISEAIERRLADLRIAHVPLVILDAPVLLKARWDRFCDHLIFVDAPAEQRLARVRERGWSEAEWRRREAAQEPLDRKRALCDTLIDNGSGLERTRAQVDAVVDRWLAADRTNLSPRCGKETDGGGNPR